jgi:hypothetical protein
MTSSNRTLLALWVLLFLVFYGVYWLGHNGIVTSFPAGYQESVRSWSRTVGYVLAPLGGEEREAPAPTYIAMTIETHPADAQVRVMNIKPRYRPGIQLAPGRYDIAVSAPGFQPQRRWVKLDGSNNRFTFILDSL